MLKLNNFSFIKVSLFQICIYKTISYVFLNYFANAIVCRCTVSALILCHHKFSINSSTILESPNNNFRMLFELCMHNTN